MNINEHVQRVKVNSAAKLLIELVNQQNRSRLTSYEEHGEGSSKCRLPCHCAMDYTLADET